MKNRNTYFVISTLLSFILIFISIKNAGGFLRYLVLNKFEISETQQIFFFNYKIFASISIFLGLSSNNKWIKYFTILLAVSFVSLEILGAKRFLLLVVATYVIVLFIKQIRLVHILGLFSGLFFLTFIKYSYYNWRQFFLGQITFSDIFWFEWADVLKDTILISECQGHILLAANYIEESISLSTQYWLSSLVVSIPFGHKLVHDYQSAGDYLQHYYNISWGGLASSIYIISYLSLGFIGVFFIYSLYITIIYFLSQLIRISSSPFFKLLFWSILPLLLFYIQREELSMLTKNIFIYGAAVLIILIFSLPFSIKNKF